MVYFEKYGLENHSFCPLHLNINNLSTLMLNYNKMRLLAPIYIYDKFPIEAYCALIDFPCIHNSFTTNTSVI